MTSPFGSDDEEIAHGELLDDLGEGEPDTPPADAGAGGEEPAAP